VIIVIAYSLFGGAVAARMPMRDVCLRDVAHNSAASRGYL
jgi:hypothetical protein